MFRFKLPRLRAGQPLQARPINQFVKAVEYVGRTSTVAPIGMMDTPGGRMVYSQAVRPFFVRLSGTSNPYTYYEAYPNAGVWTDLAGGRTGQCWEANGATGLDGQHLRIRFTSNGDYRFQALRVGNPAWLFKVFDGCDSSALAGALITLKQGGVTIATCTTGNGIAGTTLGQCTVQVPSGSYDVTIAKTGFTTYSATLTLSGTTTTSVTLAVAPGYTCVTACCSPAVPVANTLFLTYDYGTVSLAYDASGSQGAGWYGFDNPSGVTLLLGGSAPPFWPGCSVGSGCDNWSSTTGSAGVVFFLQCASGTWTLTAYWLPCNCVSDTNLCPTAPSFHGYNQSTAGSSCPGGMTCTQFTPSVFLWMNAGATCGFVMSSLAANATSSNCSTFSASFSFSSVSPKVQPITSGTVSS